MTDEQHVGRPDWAITLGAPSPALTPEAQANLRQLAVIRAECMTLHDLLASGNQVDELIRTAVAGGANEHHVATGLGMKLQDAATLARGQSLHQLISTR